jgi:hypothetical protein
VSARKSFSTRQGELLVCPSHYELLRAGKIDPPASTEHDGRPSSAADQSGRCVPAERSELRTLAEDLAGLPSVLALDVVLGDETHGVALEVVIDATHAGVPPRVCRLIGEARATIADVTEQGNPGHPIAVVVCDR